jgi:hypothetical protein
MHQRTNADAMSVHGTTQCLAPFLCIQRNHLRPNPSSSRAPCPPSPAPAPAAPMTVLVTVLKLVYL